MLHTALGGPWPGPVVSPKLSHRSSTTRPSSASFLLLDRGAWGRRSREWAQQRRSAAWCVSGMTCPASSRAGERVTSVVPGSRTHLLARDGGPVRLTPSVCSSSILSRPRSRGDQLVESTAAEPDLDHLPVEPGLLDSESPSVVSEPASPWALRLGARPPHSVERLRDG